MFYPVVKVQVYKNELVFGPGLVTLLEGIVQTESVKEACAQMGMSYSKGWKILNRAEGELGYELLTRRHGGKTGGKCSVTQEGISLIARYKKMEEEVRNSARESFEKYFPEYRKEL